MTTARFLVGAVTLALGACGGGEIDDRSAIVEACNTQQGAGWLRREYGENYCECYADRTKENLDGESYKALAAASREELKANSEAERDAIARRNFRTNAEAEHAARSCGK